MAYSPSMLPAAGYDDLTLNVRQFQAAWQEMLRIIDGMRADGASKMPTTLSLSLDSLRYHVGTALAAIDRFLRTGGAVTDDAFEIASIDASIKAFQQELTRAQAYWSAWQAGVTASHGPVQTDVKSDAALIEAMKPTTISESVVFLAGGALVIGALILLRR